nr:MAG TPA: hypothetical protein [Caudoviricetes sp.]
MHERSLRAAKDSLMQAVNRQLQSARAKGYEAEVTPQVLRLLNLEHFRERDVQRMNQLANNPEKLRGYILTYSEETGEVFSGADAIERYNRYATSKIAKPVRQAEVVRENFEDTVQKAFVDTSQAEAFLAAVNQAMTGDTSVIDDKQWGSKFVTEHDRKWALQDSSSVIAMVHNAVQRVVNNMGLDNFARRVNAYPELFDELAAVIAGGHSKGTNSKDIAYGAASKIVEILTGSSDAMTIGDAVDAMEQAGDFAEEFEE